MPQIIRNTTVIGTVLYEWEIQEYEHYTRGTWWYVFIVFISLILVLFGLLTQNFLFSLIIILSGIILFLQAHQQPQHVPFAITDLGVIVGSRFYTYSEFRSFYIIYQPPITKMLYLSTKSVFRPMLRIPLSNIDPVELRHMLRDYVDEDIEKEEEPAIDTFIRNWKIH